MKDKKASFGDLLSPPIREIDKWSDFVDSVDEIFNLNIEDPLKQIESLRLLLPTQGKEELQKTAKLLGFNLEGDVLELSTSNLGKLVTQLSLYYESNGTALFVKFIDLVLNAQTEVIQLWTEDYTTFYKEPRGALLKDGGTWYKTTHVELAIALLSSYPILTYGQTLTSRIIDLFYQNSPINLVIKNFWFVSNLSTSIRISTLNPSVNNTEGLLNFGYHELNVWPEPLTLKLATSTWLSKPTHTLTIGN